jgi:predicted RNA-binding Zn-ribbon protein involved in translation (DUF1610 family)
VKIKVKINKIPVKRPTATAQFDSDCPGCGNEIVTGDTITLIKEENAWVCVDCAWEDEKNG